MSARSLIVRSWRIDMVMRYVLFALVMILDTAVAAAPRSVGLFPDYISADAHVPTDMLPDAPLLGNGHLGVLLYSTNQAQANATYPPGISNTLDVRMSTTSAWSCGMSPTPATNVSCRAVAIGGVSFSLQPTWGTVPVPVFRAEQQLATATLVATFRDAETTNVTFVTFMDPAKDIVVTNVSFVSSKLSNFSLDVSTWVLGASTAGNHPAPSACSCDTVSRSLSTQLPLPSEGQVVATLATGMLSGTGIDVSSNCSLYRGKESWQSTRRVVLQAGATLTVVTAEAESWNGGDPAHNASALLASALGDVEGVRTAGLTWWGSFWQRSSISLPSRPQIEELFNGLQYALGCSSSTNPEMPPPALFSPWQTSDTGSWNGDMTLDYNEESIFFGAFSANHAAQVESYYDLIEAWLPAGLRLAQQRATEAHIKCASNALWLPAHIAPWGSRSFDHSFYMSWNGNFAVLPFISAFEYSGDLFLANRTYNLLDGLMAWWHCYLVKRDGQYFDESLHMPDEEHENQKVVNPQIALAFIKRVANAMEAIGKALGRRPPEYVADIAEHLAPFNNITTTVPSDTFKVENGTRCEHDFHETTSVSSPSACEVLCRANQQCLKWTWCGARTKDCARGNSCWFFKENAPCVKESNWVTGIRLPGNKTGQVWTAFKGASVKASDEFAMYPIWPAETVSSGGNEAPDFALTAQLSARTYLNLQSGRGVDVFAMAVLSGQTGAEGGFTPGEVLAGIESFLGTFQTKCLLPHARGGGVELIGMTRPIVDMLLTTQNNSLGSPIRLFAFWPDNEPAAFTGLVAKGGFEVDATKSDGQVVSPIYITLKSSSAASTTCFLESPWPKASNISVLCGSVHVPASMTQKGVFSFEVSARTRCAIMAVP